MCVCCALRPAHIRKRSVSAVLLPQNLAVNFATGDGFASFDISEFDGWSAELNVATDGSATVSIRYLSVSTCPCASTLCLVELLFLDHWQADCPFRLRIGDTSNSLNDVRGPQCDVDEFQSPR